MEYLVEPLVEEVEIAPLQDCQCAWGDGLTSPCGCQGPNFFQCIGALR